MISAKSKNNALEGIVLAGGQGTRLRKVLPDQQKVIAPVGSEPFLFRVLKNFSEAGIKKVVLALGYKANEVLSSIQSRIPPGMTIIPSVEQNPMGTGGAVRHALKFICSDDILISNGDSLIDYPLLNLINFHRNRQARATLLLCEVPDVSRYGEVLLDSTGVILSFREKKKKSFHPGIINAGVYIMTRKLIEGFPESPHSLERTTLRKLCGQGLYGLATQAPFIDIGTPADYAKVVNFFSHLDKSNS